MDVISRQDGPLANYKTGCSLHFKGGDVISEKGNGNVVYNMFDDRDSTIGYRLRVKKFQDVEKLNWISTESRTEDGVEKGCLKATSPVLVGDLFERSGTLIGDEDFEGNGETNLGNRIWRAVIVLRVTN